MTPWYSLENKTIWTVGGAGYLGSAVTEALDPLCQKSICIDLGDRAAQLVREKKLTHTIPLSCDVTDTDQLQAFVDRTIAQHGVPDSVAYLVFASSKGKRLEELTKADFLHTFEQALPPAFLFCRALAERMKPRGHGSIVLFGSMYGQVSPDVRIYDEPMKPNPVDFGPSKAALMHLMRYFAVHYGPAGIRFNCVTPGPFPPPAVGESAPEFVEKLSRKTVLHRIGKNSEIVGPTLFLLTDSASFVTGHSLVVDGGWTIW